MDTVSGIWFSDVTDLRKEGLKAFVSQSLGQPSNELEALGGDASFRRYFRTAGFIAVDSPPSTQKNAEFVRIDKALAAQGVRVPKILNYDLKAGYLLEEDLGKLTFSEIARGDVCPSWYQKAIVLLPKIASVNLELPKFDAEFILREFTIFTEWFLDKTLHLELSVGEQNMLKNVLKVLTDACLSQPQVAMHRDFHSRNLMVCGDALAVIDFQDMVKGPLTYDAASLIYDCYVKLSPTLASTLTKKAYELLSKWCPKFSFDDFNQALLLVSLQRHLKVLGIFNRLSQRDGKHGYLKDLPLVLEYALNESLAVGLYDFHDFLSTKVKGAVLCGQ